MTASTPPPPPGAPLTPGGPLASWGSRVGAYLIDWAVAVIPAFAVLALGGLLGTTSSAGDDGFSLIRGVSVVFIMVGSILGLAISIWNYGARQGSTGQTVGKGALGITVLDTQGQVLGFWRSILRTLLMSILGSLCFLNYFWPLWDDQKRTWHDMIMDTRVYDAS